MVNRAVGVAILGYQMYKTLDLKTDAKNFAKTAEKFQKTLGKELVTKGLPDYWKQKYEKLDECLKYQPFGYGYGFHYCVGL